MKLTRTEKDGGVVVEVHGKLIGGPENADMFHALFKTLLEENKKKVVVSLHHTSLMNSQGLGMLIGSYTSIKNAAGIMVLADVAAERIRDILTVTDLVRVFKTFDTVDEALEFLKQQDV